MKVKNYKIWEDYPIGTKAFVDCDVDCEGYWTKVKTGWEWCTGGIVPEPRDWLFSGWVEVPITKLRITTTI